MKISGDYEQLAKMVKGLSLAEPTLKKAVVSATNKTIVSTRAYAVKEVIKEYKISAKDVRSELVISRASYRKPVAKIIGSGSPGAALYKFAPTPKRTPSTKRTKIGGYTPKSGIKVMIHKGSRKTVHGAFIAKMRSGNVGVFKRRKNSKQIDELFGPSPLRIIDTELFKNKIDTFAGVTMDKNMLREATYYLTRAGVLPNA